MTMKRQWIGRIRKYLRWLVLFVLLFLLLLWGAASWIVRLPIVKKSIEAKLSQAAGGEIRAEAFYPNLLGGISVATMQAEFPTANPLRINMDSLRLSNPLFSWTIVRSYQTSVSLSGKTVFSASRITASMRSAWNPSRFQVTVSRARLDLEPLLATPSKGNIESSTFDIPANSSLDIDQLFLNTPGYLENCRWDVEARSGEEGKNIDARVRVSANDGAISAHVRYDFARRVLDSMDMEFSRFPLSASYPIFIAAIVDGTAAMRQKGEEGYFLRLHTDLRNAYADWINGATIRIPAIRVDMDARLSLDYLPIDVSSTIVHSPITFSSSQLGKIDIPAGALAFERIASGSATSFSGRWDGENLGAVAFSAPDWPLAVTAPLDVNFSIVNQSLSRLAAFLPESYKPLVAAVSGSVSLTGDMKWRAGRIERYNAALSLAGAEYASGAARIHNASLTGMIQGNWEKGSAVFTAWAKPGMILNGSEETPLEIEPFQIEAEYNNEGKNYSLRIKPFNTELFQSLRAQYESNGKWEVEAVLPLEGKIQKIWSALFPASHREVEGMGELNLSANGKGDEIRFSAESPDMSAYSFNQDPAIGTQLRELELKGRFQSNGEGRTIAVELSASTPYVSFAGNDYEWVGKRIAASLSATLDEPSRGQMEIVPPGGGKAIIVLAPGKPGHLEFSGLNLKEFLLPAAARFAAKAKEGESPYGLSGDGLADGWMDWEASAQGFSVKGAVTLSHTNLARDGVPALSIRNATISVPFCYPLNFDALPYKEITMNAASASVEEATFAPAVFSIPISASAVGLANTFALPLFGGEIKLEELALENWQTPSPRLQSRISMKNLDLEKMSRAIPLLPGKGTLSGAIEEIVFFRDLYRVRGRLEIAAFGGRMILNDIYLQNPLAETKIVGVDVELEQLNLKPLCAYLNFGSMTGTISGKMSQVQIEIPPANSGETIKPIRFEIEIESDSDKEEKISYKSLMTIVKLGKSDLPAEGFVQRDAYNYSGFGLRASLEGNEMRLTGLLDDQFVIGHTKKKMKLFGREFFFADTVGVRFPDSKKTLDFDDFWMNLLQMSKRLSSGGMGMPKVESH